MTYHIYNIPALGDFEQDLEKITQAENKYAELHSGCREINFVRRTAQIFGTISFALTLDGFLNYNLPPDFYILGTGLVIGCFIVNTSLSKLHKQEERMLMNAKKNLASLEKKLNIQTTQI